MVLYSWVMYLKYNAKEINDMVITYQKTSDRALLDEIVKNTYGLVNKFGKSFKIPVEERNSLYGVALMKALRNWYSEGRASFTSYLSAIIINELKMYLRKKQMRFENDMLQELEEHGFEHILADDLHISVEHKYIIEEVIESFPKEKTRQALHMLVNGYNVEFIVKHLDIGRTNFYADLKQFREDIKEEFRNAEICV